MLTLQTFGTPSLAKKDGNPLPGAAGQRRLVALIAYLAAVGPSAVSRDRLLGIFWPDSDGERARRALAQALYHARKTLACDTLFLGNADIRLNPETIDVDVWTFDQAITAGELERAAEIYQGAFLDGFYLTGNAEFEQWASAERDRRAHVAHDVFVRLAKSAEQARDWTRAVHWWRRFAATDPLDTAATVGLITALRAAGDRTGALRQAQIHENLVREQLGMGVDPQISALVDQLRRDVMANDGVRVSIVEQPVGEPTSEFADDVNTRTARHSDPSDAVTSEAVAPVQPVSDVNMPSLPVPPTVATPDGRRSRFSKLPKKAIFFGALMALLLLVVGTVLTRQRATPLIPRQPLVVAPFRVAAADPSLSYLRAGMVELLSTRLADERLIRSVDPGAVLGVWRAHGFTRVVDVPRTDIVRAAATLGASKVVLGSVVGNPNKLVVNATLLAVPSGEVMADVTVEGAVDNLTGLIDRIAAGLLATEANEADRLANQTTLSLTALRAFLEGQGAYRRGEYDAAARQYERALHVDSSFALAALQLALAADQTNDIVQRDWALRLAWTSRSELSARDQAYLTAFAGPQYPSLSPSTEQFAAWERAATLAPDRAEVWYALGREYIRDGTVVGTPDGYNRAVSALERALELDPRYAPSRRVLILIAAKHGDTAILSRFATSAALRDSMGNLAPFMRWRIAVARENQAALRGIRANLYKYDRANLRAIAMISQSDVVALDDGEHAIQLLRRMPVVRMADQLDVLLAEHSFALNAGRPQSALAVTQRLQEVFPGTHAALRLRILDALYGEGDRNAAVQDANVLSALVNPVADQQPIADPERLANLCVVGQWRLASGEATGIDRTIKELRNAETPRTIVPVATNPTVCAAMLEATAAVLGHRRNAPRLLDELNGLILTGPAAGDVGAYAHLVIARLYEQLGDRTHALSAIRRQPYATTWPRYLASTRREEGRLAMLVGDRSGARDAYTQYLELRETPEASMRSEVSRVRTQLMATTVASIAH